MKTEIGLVYSLILLSMLACNSTPLTPIATPSPTSQPIVGLNELQFLDSETGRRFRYLNYCINTLVDASWQTTPPRMEGSFYTSRWCRGAAARFDCQIAYATVNYRDQQVIELYTLSYPQTYLKAFGLGLQVLWVPESTGWGVLFDFAEKGDSIVGDGWGVSFMEFLNSSGQPNATVNLGWNYIYTIPDSSQTTFEYSSGLPVREDLMLYLSAPDAMRDRGLAQMHALEQKVITAINAHQVNTCDLGPYLGNGIPPACTPRPLTAKEEATELARAKAYFSEQEQLLRTHYQEMYAAWLLAFPFDRCWP